MVLLLLLPLLQARLAAALEVPLDRKGHTNKHTRLTHFEYMNTVIGTRQKKLL